MSQLSLRTLTATDFLSWLYLVIRFICKILWTLNSEPWLMISINAGEHVENWYQVSPVTFAWFQPPWTEHQTLGETSLNMFVLVNVTLEFYVWIQSQLKFALLYTFHTEATKSFFFAEMFCFCIILPILMYLSYQNPTLMFCFPVFKNPCEASIIWELKVQFISPLILHS